MNPAVDEYIQNAEKWQSELLLLRKILLDCGLEETLKWKAPCYTCEGANVIMIGELKDCCTISFFKGALLKDPERILKKPGENTRAARVIRFTGVQEIEDLKSSLQACIDEAIKVEKAGLQFDFEEQRELDMPEELVRKLEENEPLKTAFYALTPGRQRAYILYFSGAKQSSTRESRIDKYTPRILDGKGLNDCTCGLSKRMPGCDGSHKSISSGKT